MIGASYDVAQDDPDSKLGPMKRGDVVKNFVSICCALRTDQVGLRLEESAYYKNLKPTSEQAFPVYVENIIVRDNELAVLPKQPDIPHLRA